MLNDHPDVASIETICRAHAPFGTTALLPTLITDTPAITAAAVAAGAQAARKKVPGFLGLHLEGPHLSIARKGAHDPALIRPMTDADQAALIAACKNLPVLLTTIAPESVEPARVAALAKAGIVVSLGHSDTGYATAKAFAEAGASVVTHLFNAMLPQRPYIPTGTLRRVVAYPAAADKWTIKQIKAALDKVGLGYLTDRIGEDLPWRGAL